MTLFLNKVRFLRFFNKVKRLILNYMLSTVQNLRKSISTCFTTLSILLTIILILWSSTIAQAQQRSQVSGVILDLADFSAVANASVNLIKPGTETVVAATQTSEQGGFILQDVAAGSYTLRITFLGYEDYSQENIRVQDGQALNLGNIYIKQAGQMIEEIVIRAAAPTLQLGIDRKIFNVAESTVSIGGSATDLLSNVPSLEVDMDGSISLRGSSSVKILIDGKESAMAGSDINSLLQSMPASSIERIELITNPSSRYDAEGQTGIINIVLKKDMRTGLNGSVNTSAGSYENYGAGINLNFRDRRLNYFGSYNYNHRNNIGDGTNTTQLLATNSLTTNTSESRRLGVNNGVKLGVDYYITDYTTIGLSGNVSVRRNSRNEDIFYNYINHPSLNGNSERYSEQNEDDLGYDINLDFKHQFKRQQEEIVANIGYGNDGEEGANSFQQSFLGGQNSEQRLNTSKEDGRNFNFQVDYVRPFGEDHKLEMGFRSNIRQRFDHQFSRLGYDGGEMTPDYAVSNDFDMESQVHALYGNYQKKFSETFGLQVGIRAEQAYLTTSYYNLDPAIPANSRRTDGKQDYFRIYPSVFLTKEFGEGNQLQTSYTRRVRRPGGWQVNPFVDVSDPLNLRQGNPDLLPEDIHSFELSYAKFWNAVTLTSSVYHRRMYDVSQPIIVEVDETSGATYSKWENISKNQTSGFELISKMDLHKNFDVMANFNAYYTKYHGSEEFGIAPAEGFSWNTNATLNARFTPKLSMQTRLNYRAPRVQAQGESVGNFVVDAGLKMDVMQKRGSIMFNVRDLFNQRRNGGYTHTQHVYREYESRWMKRTFTLTFTYRFGQQDFNKNQRNDQQDDFGDDQF
jgi:outer membrane receptor protein involved in Fe transport